MKSKGPVEERVQTTSGSLMRDLTFKFFVWNKVHRFDSKM